MRAMCTWVAVAACAAGLQGGPIQPPGGPVAPTSATIEQIKTNVDAIKADADALLATLEGVPLATPIESLPSALGVDFVIDEPGVYVLTDNWFGDGANDAIEVRVSNVVIDLNGFMIDGDPNMGGRAIDTLGGVNNVVVRNGSIREYDGGIRLNGENNLVEDVRLYFITGTAISVGGNSTVLRSMCRITLAGIQVGDSSAILDSVSSSSSGTAFRLGEASVASNCAASFSQIGFDASSGCVIDGCASSDNNTGYDVIGTVVSGCAAFRNTADGFVGTLSRFMGCHADSNGEDGFQLNAGNHVQRCSATSNTANGFHIVGVRNRVQSNHAAVNSANYRTSLQADDSIITGNYSEGPLSYAIADVNILMLGTIRTDFTNATNWDNFSQ